MDLKDFLAECVEKENINKKNKKLKYFLPTSIDKIVKLYKTYNGSKSKMHPLDYARVSEYLDKGFAFVGAKCDDELVGITVSRQFPENYPYFALPKNEVKGEIYTLGGLYVHPDFQGQGIATKLSHIAVNGTENFGRKTGKAVGIGYEVSYDNEKSLNTLSKQGNYIGYYYDKNQQEGLSILLYRPFCHQALKINHGTIKLSKDEASSFQNLNHGLISMGFQKDVGGITKRVHILDDGNEVTTCVINNTVDTVTEPLFYFEK